MQSLVVCWAQIIGNVSSDSVYDTLNENNQCVRILVLYISFVSRSFTTIKVYSKLSNVYVGSIFLNIDADTIVICSRDSLVEDKCNHIIFGLIGYT